MCILSLRVNSMWNDTLCIKNQELTVWMILKSDLLMLTIRRLTMFVRSRKELLFEKWVTSQSLEKKNVMMISSLKALINALLWHLRSIWWKFKISWDISNEMNSHIKSSMIRSITVEKQSRLSSMSPNKQSSKSDENSPSETMKCLLSNTSLNLDLNPLFSLNQDKSDPQLSKPSNNLSHVTSMPRQTTESTSTISPNSQIHPKNSNSTLTPSSEDLNKPPYLKNETM